MYRRRAAIRVVRRVGRPAVCRQRDPVSCRAARRRKGARATRDNERASERATSWQNVARSRTAADAALVPTAVAWKATGDKT